MADLFTDDPAAFDADADLPALEDGDRFWARYYTRIRTHLANMNNRIRGASGAVFALIGDLTARDVTARKLIASAGTSLIAANIVLGAGWGASPTVLVIANGKANRFRYQITCGTVPAASPTATITLPDGGFAAGAIANAQHNGGSGASNRLFWTQPTTTIVVTYGGTPVAGLTYAVDVQIMG